MKPCVIEFVPTHPEFQLIAATADAAGYDMMYLEPGVMAGEGKTVVLNPGERKLFPLGARFAIPRGWHIKVVPRSGLALKEGLTLANSPGIIDADYRGELGAIVINLSDEPREIKHGQRICQILVERVNSVTFKPVQELSDTERGEGGFGSTGKA